MSVNIEQHQDREHDYASKAENLVDLLRLRAINQPDLLAFTFLEDGEREEARLTYGDLDRRAREVAGWLLEMGLRRERALLIYPPGLDYVAAFFGCLYAGVVAVPVPPINPVQTRRGLPQLESIVNDAKPVLALTTSRILSKLDQLLLKSRSLAAISWQSMNQVSEDCAQQWRRPRIDEQTLAYLQYTSGSTAAAKGVMVSHGNVMDNSEDNAQVLSHTTDSLAVSWLPHFHDMGLVYGIIQPVYGGIPGVLMSPVSFIQRPIRWLKVISDYRATYSGGPNFAYQLCARKVTPEQCETLDLGAWRIAINGAEPVRRETIEGFAKAFRPYGFSLSSFCPAYGLAEATLMVTIAHRKQTPDWLKINRDALEQNRVVEATEDEHDSLTMVGCGRPAPTTTVIIVNPDSLTECSPSEVGEIWVSGPASLKGIGACPAKPSEPSKPASRGRVMGHFFVQAIWDSSGMASYSYPVASKT